MNPLKEIFRQSTAQFWGEPRLLALLFAGVASAFLIERRLASSISIRAQRWAASLAIAGVVGAGLWLGWQTAFVCDDAFISFRYADNLARGYGLVFNKGEWVEGYTNFLWTVMLAGAARLGGDIPLTALFGDLFFFVVALVLVAATVRRIGPKKQVFPFAAIALAGASAFHSFATSGLETMPAAALIVVGLYTSTFRRGALLSGLALTAASLMRPDHVLFYACFGLSLAVEDVAHGKGSLFGRLRIRRYVAYLLPFFLIYIPYFVLRYRAYGDFYPNTYYAKSGDRAYWSQGFVYLFHFVSTSGAWMWVWAALLAVIGRPRSRSHTRIQAFALLAVPLFTVYIVKVGGDFMEHRFFVPLMPVLAIVTEVSLRARLAHPRKPWTRTALPVLAALGLTAALVPVELLKGRGMQWNLAHEPGFYRVKTVRPLVIDCPWEKIGKGLYEAYTAKGIEPPIAGGAIGLLGYYSKLPLVDGLGLTNRNIAHKPIKSRGRPGHEKVANVEEVIAEGAVLDVGFRYDPYFQSSAQVSLGRSRLYFLRFDPEWAARIKAIRGARVPSPEHDIQELTEKGSRERVLAGLSFFQKFLAIHPDKDVLLARIEERLGAICDFEESLCGAPKPDGKGLKRERGKRPTGASGEGWLGSLPEPKKGKGRTGRVEIPIAEIAAKELRFVLGGARSDGVFIELQVGGRTVRHESPTGAPGLVPVAWDISEFLGDSGVLVIEDTDSKRGNGILVDAIHFPPVNGDIRERIATGTRRFDPLFGDLYKEAREILPESDPMLRALAARVAAHWSLDTLPEGTTITGKAFGKGPVPGALREQEPVLGVEGSGLLNSFHGKDLATGKVELPEMTLPQKPITLLVAGGGNCSRVYVGIEVEGNVVPRLCGKNDGLLRRYELRPGALAGRRGRIVIVDNAEGGWGHIMVDDILVPR